MRKDKDKYIKRDKSFYDKKYLSDRQYLTSYRDVLRDEPCYLLGDTSDKYYKILFENKDFISYLERAQLLGLNDIGYINLEVDIDDYTHCTINVSKFSNINRSGYKIHSIVNDKVEVDSYRLVNYTGEALSYMMFGNIMLEFTFDIKLDIRKLLENNKILLVNHIVRNLEFTGDFSLLEGKEINGIVREKRPKNALGNLFVINEDMVFNNTQINLLQLFDSQAVVNDSCICKNCMIHTFGEIDKAVYSYYRRFGNIFK